MKDNEVCSCFFYPAHSPHRNLRSQVREEGRALVGILLVMLLLVAVGLLAWPYLHTERAPKFETEYQAVLLSGGQLYYGKLEGFGTAFPVLRDIYYVQSQIDPQTKAATNILIQRGKEWHGPDRMYLNPASIILVEPVSPSSKVARLIAEARKK